MKRKYENPNVDFLWIKGDLLTMSSDNDSPFDSTGDDEENWGGYY